MHSRRVWWTKSDGRGIHSHTRTCVHTCTRRHTRTGTQQHSNAQTQIHVRTHTRTFHSRRSLSHWVASDFDLRLESGGEYNTHTHTHVHTSNPHAPTCTRTHVSPKHEQAHTQTQTHTRVSSNHTRVFHTHVSHTRTHAHRACTVGLVSPRECLEPHAGARRPAYCRSRQGAKHVYFMCRATTHTHGCITTCHRLESTFPTQPFRSPLHPCTPSLSS